MFVRPVSPVRWVVALSAATALATGLATPAFAAPGVEPAVVDRTTNPNTSFVVDKIVHTPAIPPNPDVVLLVDTTGSMGPSIDNVKANLHDVITAVKSSQPTAQFAVASYKDETDGPAVFTVNTPLTDVEAAVQAGVDTLVPAGGGDLPEAWINALFQVSTGAIAYRAGSSRIVVVVGDATSHDPSVGHTLADAITALKAVSTRVIGVDVLDLNGAGQATAVADATGGSVVPVSADGVSAAILAGLRDLDVTVEPKATCDAGLSVSFDNPSVTLTSGKDAAFKETVQVAADAKQGATLHCTVEFLLNGKPGGPAFVQQINVKVNDTTPPKASCVPGPNPGGKIPSSSNPDGFYTIGATDNLDPAVQVFIRDTGSDAVFGPYKSTTNIKLVQAPGATPNVSPGSGAVDIKVTLKGDAIITGVDAAGNTSVGVTCLVPPGPKK